MLSIITAFYNSTKTIQKLVECLKKQTNNDFEWIIVDDCSKEEEKDNLLTNINGLSFQTKIRSNKVNCGPGESRSNGLKFAMGDYIVFVDSDDIVSSDFVDTILSNFKYTDAEIVAFDYARIQGEKITTCKKIDNTSAGEVPIDRFILYAKTCICGCAFNRVFLNKNSIMFPKLYRYEDWVFNVRAAIKSTKIFYVEKVLYYYIFESDSLVNSGKYDAGEFSIKAFSLINQDLILFDKTVSKLLYAREVMYVNAVSKAVRLSFNEYKMFIEVLKDNHSYSGVKYDDAILLHQKVILKLVDLNMYRVLRFCLKLITK